MKTITKFVCPALAVFALICLVLLPPARATATGTSQVVIYGAMANLTTHVLTISGDNFGSTTPTVTLDNMSLTVTSFTPTTIQATLPNSVTPGSYLLTVSTGTGSTYNAIFDVSAFNDTAAGESRGNGNTAAENVDALNSNTTGVDNTAHGWQSLFSNTTGTGNTADAFDSLYSNASGNWNTAMGFKALFNATTANQNTAVGANALFSTNADGNTAVGYNALYSDTTAGENTAIGASALYQNTTGFSNTATGYETLYNNNGNANTGFGFFTLHENTGASDNTAMGHLAMYDNINGGDNTAVGSWALRYNQYGSGNVAVGRSAFQIGGGNYNVAVGVEALFQNSSFLNTAVGYTSMHSNYGGSRNTAVGQGALHNNTNGNQNIGIGDGGGYYIDTGSNNIDIGNYGVMGDNGIIRIGTAGTNMATFIAGISGTPVVGDTVVVDTNGQLGTLASAARFKKDVQPMDKNSEAVLALKPVSFRYKNDSKATPQFGLIAEEVAKVNPDLVVRDRKGEIYSVRYEAVNAMLLNEFLKAHRRIEEQDKQIDQLTAQLKEQALQIQKVNDKVELNRPAPQTVADDQR